MKVLWITNTLFPDVCKSLNIPTPVVGGWMYASAESLLKEFGEVQLGVASIYKGKEFQIREINGVTYYLLPSSSRTSYSIELEGVWGKVREHFQPDVTHIHGSEYPHGLAYVNGVGSKNVVVSIQGLISVCERYCFAGISTSVLLKNMTLRDCVRRDTIFRQRKGMRRRGNFETLLLKKVNDVIGRTSWDRTQVWGINSNAKYHFCNETLREEFYGHSWDYSNCEPYRIFLSQAHYPLKGLHQLIRALPLVLREFPNTKVYVAGNNFTNVENWRLSGYGKYIRSLLKKHNLTDRFVFTGILTAAEMRQQYLKSNVFVCPSSIENSPNSVGEAQLLGVPCVASYVGGTPDMIKHETSGLLYRFEETEMLAKSLCRIFKDPDWAKKLGVKGQKNAMERHNQHYNTKALHSIYSELCNGL
ncbi:glycosyltransferase family 4 protein [Sunxiuqinia elliptica]|uniref:Glycosyltransferase involved in cell wall biosynthesis n=1 Tax=Sunxiuqinia elliptica TaxID=655355 RepID=A0A4R6H459_9BACT|nr:glycosyltransferase family 4 protein [Sunxiuqinia elliptica]TDO02674.1 glycosyltransferase involved in cell wall biosynthesis [Sunxiuqinia elliptica]TDO58588.1 glycosyltransferase involved in cell wall biosynthesis [Sunxiuqinia elliptica]